MRLRSLLKASGPWPDGVEPEVIAARVGGQWRGVRVYMRRPACKVAWRRERREPAGAAELLARDIESAILAEGGSDAHVTGVLIGCMGSYIEV